MILCLHEVNRQEQCLKSTICQALTAIEYLYLYSVFLWRTVWENPKPLGDSGPAHIGGVPHRPLNLTLAANLVCSGGLRRMLAPPASVISSVLFNSAGRNPPRSSEVGFRALKYIYLCFKYRCSGKFRAKHSCGCCGTPADSRGAVRHFSSVRSQAQNPFRCSPRSSAVFVSKLS